MFNNVGGKLKAIAKVIFWIFVVIFAISGIVLFANMVRQNGGLAFLSAVLTIGLGVLTAWLSSIGLYAFGELVENTSIIAENTKPRA